MIESTTDRPGSLRLSVVIASSNAGALLHWCLDSLAAQADPATVEIIVARDAGRFADVDRAGTPGRRQQVRWIEAPPGSTVPRLRGLGIAVANGEFVALLEDDCIVEPGWCEAAATLDGRDAAVGGAVEPGPYHRALDWAVYFCEYGRFMLPVPADGTAPLTGNNVVYTQAALETLPDSARADFRDVFVHTAWQDAGVRTRVDGALVVRNVNTWSIRHVTSVPYHHGRAFAARRFGGRRAAVRGAVALLTAGMPAIKMWRIARGTLGRGRLAGRLAMAVPWMMVFVGCWSAGEIVGCVAGPGDSSSRWR